MAIVNALVVWADIPEDIRFLVLKVDSKGPAIEKLRRFHDHYINSTGTPDELQDEMNDFFYDPNGTFKYEASVQEGPLNDDFELIIKCGFIL